MSTPIRKLELTSGLLAAIPGLTITFWANHSAAAGLLIFGIWAVIAGLILAALSWRWRADLTGPWRLIAWLWTVVLGVFSLVLPASALVCALALGIWALGFGLALVIGELRADASRTRLGERFFVGAISLLLGLVELLLPRNAVVSVGLLGAYFVVVGVWLVIGALSPRANVDGEGASVS